MLIARPIRQLDQAIRRMGTADFTHAIEVNGPQDLRYVGQRLEWLRSRLNELEQQQTRFLRHVSHELKTPLTAVREGAELLRDNVGGRLSPEQQDIVRIVRENTLSLQKLIEDLLTYHQTRAMEPVTLGPVPLPDVVRRVLREQKLAALARMITFDARSAPVVVTGDAEKIRTVVDNLLSNAIKYSPRSGVIEIAAVAQDGFAVLDVVGRGPGHRAGRARARVRFLLLGQGARRRQGEGFGPRACDRARVRACAVGAHRGARSRRRQARRAVPPVAAACRRRGNALRRDVARRAVAAGRRRAQVTLALRGIALAALLRSARQAARHPRRR